MVISQIKKYPKTIVAFFCVLSLVALGLAVSWAIKSNQSIDDTNNPDNNSNKDVLDSKYFDKSILRLLKSSEMTLETKISVFSVSNQNKKSKKVLLNVVEGLYDFKSQVEKESLEDYKDGKKTGSYDVLTVDNLNEIYEIDYKLRTCQSFDSSSRERILNSYLSNWFPTEFLNKDLDNIMLSPNYIVHYLNQQDLKTFQQACKLIKNKKDTDNNQLNEKDADNSQLKCEIVENEVAKIEFYFENFNEFTLYPKKIDVFKRKTTEDDWNLYRQIEYSKFITLSKGQKTDLNSLPIALECERKNKSKYDKLREFFSNTYDFYLYYDLSLTYTDKKTKEIVTKSHSSVMYDFRPSFYNYEQLSTFVNEGVNEETDQPMTTFYDRNSQQFYDSYPVEQGDGKCIRHSYRKSKNISLNWFYFQDLFFEDRKFFDISNKDYSYLGAHRIDGSDSLAFETVLNGFNKMKKDNELTYDNSHSKNVNNISSDHIIATYYYDKAESRFGAVYGMLKIPFKIEFRFKGDDKKTEIAKLTVNNKVYGPFDGSIFKSFENCIKSNGYDVVIIKYTGFTKGVYRKKLENFFAYEVRDKIRRYIADLRMNNMTVRIVDPEDEEEKTAFYVKFRLYEPFDSEGHFDMIKDSDFKDYDFDDKHIIKNIKKEECARTCLNKEDCAAYSHDESSLVCKLCTIESFNEKLYSKLKNNEQFDFSQYFSITEKKGSTMGLRFALYTFARHAFNSEVIQRLKEEIKDEYFATNLNVYIDDVHGERREFVAKDVHSNKGDGSPDN